LDFTDLIDSGNYKKAVHEADRLLKKQKDLVCAKVLKALSLLRLNRRHEAEDILLPVFEAIPTDEATLQAMTLCYREMSKPEVISELYERAVKKLSSSNNPSMGSQVEELMSHLFMSYVRTGDFQKQQLTANNLFKLSGKNPYYFWSIMSTYLQAVSSSKNGDDKKETLLLTLAGKKVEKFISESRVDADAEVELYLMILERQKRFKDMISVIEGPLGKLLPNSCDFLSRRKAFLLDTCGDKEASFDAFLTLIDRNQDQLEYYNEAMKLAIDLGSSHVTRLSSLISRIKKQEMSCSRGKHRGPFLSGISLFYYLQKEKAKNADSLSCLMESCSIQSPDDGVRLFEELFDHFGHKSCFYSDVTFLWHEIDSCRQDVEKFVFNRLEVEYDVVAADVLSKLSVHESFDEKKLVDNRDIRVFSTLTLDVQSRMTDWQEWTFNWETHWVHLNTLIQQLLIDANLIMTTLRREKEDNKPDGIPNGQFSLLIESFEKKLEQTKALVDSIKLKDRQMPDSLRNQFIVGSHIPQVISFVENGYVDAIIAAFDILRDSIRNQVGSLERIDISASKHRIDQVVSNLLSRMSCQTPTSGHSPNPVLT